MVRCIVYLLNARLVDDDLGHQAAEILVAVDQHVQIGGV
jgi:hypothetical protein